MKRPRLELSLFLLLICLVRATKQNDRHKRQLSNEQPKIVTNDGHLIFQTGTNHNITFRSSQGGFVNIDGQDFRSIATLVKANKQKLDEIDSGGGSGDVGRRLTRVEDRLDSLVATGEVLQRLNMVTTQLGDLTNRVATLESSSPATSAPSSGGADYSSLSGRVTALQRTLSRLRRKLRQNECNSNPCRHGGTCVDLYDGYSCRCPPAWEGPSCSVDTNECAVLAGTDLGCQNGATCVNTPGSFQCRCTTNWHGLRCSEAHDDCTGASSEALCGHGTCINQPRVQPGQPKYMCICEVGWTTDGSDPACSQDVNECDGRTPPCSVNPVVPCVNVPGTFYCGTCPAGYSGNGHACTDINECQTNNGGCSLAPLVDCTNTVGSRQCGPCPSGYQGDGVACNYVGICNIENGGCHPLATCQPSHAGFQGRVCTCPAGYVGNGVGSTGCVASSGGSTSGPCSTNPCLHGQCQVSGSSYACSCDAGWIGTNCNQQVDPCASNPCRNGGTCTNAAGAYRCQCTDSFTGATCEQAQQSCGGRLTGESGSFRYPRETGQSYSHGASCAWVVTTSPNEILMLTFTKFKLEEHEDCNYDFVQIHDGPSASSHLLGKYCGNTLPNGGHLNTTHNQVYVWFRSDSSVSADGFEVVWNSAAPVCGGNLRDSDHGSITSPGYPGDYPNNRDCQWNVRVSPGKKVLFTFGHLTMESSANCTNDYLRITDGYYSSGHLLGLYCGSLDPAPVTASGPTARVQFHTNSDNNDRGFHITYAAIPASPGCGGTYTADTGLMISPNYPNPYPHNSQCVWTITVPSEVITLTFTNLDLETHSNCRYDYVEVRDGDDEESPFVGRYCGSQVPPPFRSNSNNLWVKFRSDSSSTGAGFRATWNVACGGTFTDPTGEVASPYFPNSYPNSKDCIYAIQQAPGAIIQLTFVTFDIEASRSGNCSQKDYVEVRNGGNADSALIGTYCGSTLPAPVTSSFNMMRLRFHSDASRQFHGFRATYATLNGGTGGSTGGAVECGGSLTAASGAFTSPAHPGVYPHGINCTWVITVIPGFIVRLTFNTFNLEQHSQCRFDYVAVYDNYTADPGRSLGKFCGSTSPPTVTSTGNTVMVRMVTDSSVAREGFSANYISLNASSVCGRDLRIATGMITSPNYPLNYPHSRDCVWTLVMPQGQQILLNVTDFAMETNPNCRYDFLEIRNGGFVTSPLIGRYCGSTIDTILRSDSNRMYIRLKTDNSQSARGFQLIYDGTSSGCGGELTAPTGSIISPNYPHPYNHRAECFWTITAAHGSTIQVVFPDFDMESHSSCAYDYVELRNDNAGGTLLAKVCGSAAPEPLTSQSNKLWIKFRTDSSNNGRGFHASYHSVCDNRLSGHRGVVESPNFPQPYTANRDCTWVIESTLGNTVNASFSHFAVEANAECTADFLELRDGQDVNSPLIGHYCGLDFLPPDVSTTGQYLYVRFKSDHSVSLNGFRLEYVTVGCGGTFNSPTGRFTSFNYPNPYPHQRECTWYINTSPGTRIELTIDDFDVEAHATCDFDALEVYGGMDLTAPQLAKLCHTQPSAQVLTSTGNHMVVRFYSDRSNSGRGFSASFRELADGCGGNFSTASGIIMSKNYPNRYPHSTDCTWLITATEGRPILLTFLDFELEGGNNCRYDYVTVHDGPDLQSSELMKTCGSAIPSPPMYHSTGNQMFVRMRSDGSVNMRGFKASYTAGCGGRLNAELDGVLVSPGWPGNYEKLSNCSWLLEAAHPGDRITLIFTHMDVEQTTGGNCSRDYVQVLDGNDDDAPEMGTYCGREAPAPLTSLGSAMVVRFTSDATIEGTGFRAVYTKSTSACGGDYTAEHGAFNSPRYPDSYPNNAECIWTFRTAPGNLIRISFSFFNLELEDNCNLDYVEIREGGPGGAVMGRYCGDQLPSNLTAGHNLWVKFRTNEDVPGQGFMAVFNSIYGGEISGVSGQLASPRYPADYPRLLDYTWTIIGPVGMQIQVTFETFDLEYARDGRCRFDYLLFRDGNAADSLLMGRYCGVEIPPLAVTTGNQLRVEFHTDADTVGQGFLFNWQAVQPAPVVVTLTPPVGQQTLPPAGCGGELVAGAQLQSLSSPGYPYGYAPRTVCVWTIRTQMGHRVWINMTDVALEWNRNCRYDYAAVYNGVTLTRNAMLGIFCGLTSDGIPRMSSGNVMTVKFRSDSGVNITGFAAEFRSECGGQILGSVGAIQSPGSPGNYPDNANCSWTVQVPVGRTITLEVTALNIQGTPGSCAGDYLQLLNGADGGSPPLGDGRYCGSTLPQIPRTGSRFLTAQFVSDASGNSAGFRFMFREHIAGCGGTLELTDTVSSAVFTSPNYPDAYPANVDCVWVITTPANERVQLDFIDNFNIEAHQGCEFDFVEARDGGTDNAALLGHYCGNTRPGTLKSSGHVMYVRFRTDGSVPRMGFKARYKIAECGGAIIAQNGFISTPNYPGNYGSNEDCEWIVTGPTGHFLTFTFEDFQMQHSINCSEDYVEIRELNSTGPLLGTYCGSRTLAPVETSDSFAYVRFHSGASNNYKGFNLRFEASVEECGGELTTPTGSFSSPNYPGVYAHRRRCVWRIQVPAGRRVTLSFTDFNIEQHASCSYDYVAVYNGALDVSYLNPYMGKYCGPENPGVIESSGNGMNVLFRTDGSVSAGGFSAMYHSNNPAVCGGVLSSTLGAGTIQSPGFETGEYTTSLQCVWVLQNQNTANSSISLEFTTLALERHGDCGWDFVEIREGGDENGHLVGRYCSNDTVTPLIVTSEPSVFITFVSDFLVTHAGFSLDYKFSDCGGMLTAPQGTISSPNYPASYDQNQACAWQIVAPEGYQIKLHFTDMSMVSSTDCQEDYLEVFNGGVATSPSMAKLCGTRQVADLRSQTNQLRLQFRSDGSGASQGFSLQYSFENDGCGGDLHTTSGRIQSPNWPESYPFNLECRWRITVPNGYHIGLAFTPPFDMEIQQPCTNDVVVLKTINPNGGMDVIGRYCGNEVPPSQETTTNKALVKFRSNQRNSGNGFRLNYDAVCGAEFTADTGVIMSPGYPRNYGNNLSCNYTIKVDPQKYIMLSFRPDHFWIEGQGRNKDPRDKFSLEYNDTSSRPEGESQPDMAGDGQASARNNATLSHYLRLIQRPLDVALWVHNHPNQAVPQSARFWCRYDYLRVFRGNSTQGTQLGRFCGQTAPQVLSSQGSMVIQFTTDAGTTDRGWIADYWVSECGGDFTDPEGSIRTPTHPHNYHHNSNCTWTITVEENRIVELKFSEFDIEPHARCVYDYVTIFDGASENATLIGRYCGDVLPPLVRSSSNVLVVNFRSDNSVSRDGFVAVYRTTYGPQQGCGGVVQMAATDGVGTLASLDVDGDGQYEPGLNCVWQIVAPENKVIRLEFTSFSLEEDATCTNYDHVEVRDGMFAVDTLVGSYCGNNLPGSFETSTGFLYVRFVSDESGQRSGFRATYRAINRLCGGSRLALEDAQNLTSPGYPGNYPPGVRCRWAIDAPESKQIQLKFTDMETQSHPLCEYDYVELKDTPRTLFSQSVVYCGTQTSPEFLSLGRSVEVTFVSDASTSARGFSLEYKVASCNRTYTEANGRIVSAGWPGIYPPSTVCEMTIMAPANHSVSLFFNAFNMEAHRLCRYDYLQIHNGSDAGSEILATLCGRTLPSPILVPGNSVFLKMVSDASVTRIGFDITYTSSPDGCGGNLTFPNGSFASPGYPGNYPQQASCQWLVRVPTRFRIHLKFTDFNIEEHDSCTNDSVTLYNGGSDQSPRVGSYCGEMNPAEYTSTTNQLFVVFSSDESNSGTGFRAEYTSVNQ